MEHQYIHISQMYYRLSQTLYKAFLLLFHPFVDAKSELCAWLKKGLGEPGAMPCNPPVKLHAIIRTQKQKGASNPFLLILPLDAMGIYSSRESGGVSFIAMYSRHSACFIVV